MKSKAHIYMANLIMDEVKKNGRVKIGETEYAVPKKVLEVIKNYPEYVRAGSVGPDFFPDLLVGQMDIHPKKSGEFLELMWDELTTMKEGSNYDQAFAFYLGFTLHYACDMFSHYYINEYAGGSFPEISSIISKGTPFSQRVDAVKIILKHITLESYMDEKVQDKNTSMNIPKKYLMRCFGTIESWKKINTIKNGKSDIKPSGFNILEGMVKEYSDALKSSKNIESRKSQELQERIDVWMTEWQNFVKQSVAGKGTDYDFNKIAKIIRKVDISGDGVDLAQALICLYQISNGPLPIVLNIFNGKYLDPMYWIGQGIQLGIYQTALKIVYESLEIKKDIPKTKEKCKDELHKIILEALTAPQTVIDAYHLFKGYDTKHFDKEWGNFGELIDCQSQTFDVFRRCLNMGKLCLVGNNNLIKIANNYNAGDYSRVFRDGVLKPYVSKISVSIKIANIAGAGTNNDVHLTIFQKSGKSHKYSLDSKSNDFRVGKEYAYTINLVEKVDLNDFDLFTLGCDFTSFTSKLVIEKMVITDIDFGYTLVELKDITIQRGKPGTGPSGNSEVPSVYKLKIHGHNFKGGTRGRAVWFTVKDKQGGSSRYRLNHKGDVFPLKEGDDFEISLNGSKKVEDLKAFEISCDYSTDSPELGLKYVKVLDVIKNITLAEPGGEYTIKKNKPLVISVNASELLKKYK